LSQWVGFLKYIILAPDHGVCGTFFEGKVVSLQAKRRRGEEFVFSKQRATKNNIKAFTCNASPG
jgi:hypothetical protein